MKNRNDESKKSDDQLEKEISNLKKEIQKLQLEKDILEEAVKLIKKSKGIDISRLTNKEKSIIINAIRTSYPLTILLKSLHISKSSYFYQNKLMRCDNKYSEVKKMMVEIFNNSFQSYGYRRMYLELKRRGIVISEKVIRRLMKEAELKIVYINKKKYNSYIGEISPAVPNVINRDFHADEPNMKMLTDITEFSISEGKVYLSPLLDCFDGLIASWSISTSPNAELVNSMLETYLNTLKNKERPVIHSDRGAHYRWPAWIKIMEEKEITRSMSKKGCSPDNSACEGFFGRLKNEMFYNRDWKNTSIESFIDQLNNYIHWYNTKRIKQSLGGMSPLDYRIHLGKV